MNNNININNVTEEENEEVERYHPLTYEILRVWGRKHVVVVTVVVGALGKVTKMMQSWIEKKVIPYV